MNLIFDIDGTLWNTTEKVAVAWQKASDELHIGNRKITGEILKGEFGKPMDVIAKDLFPCVSDGELLDHLLDLCNIYESEILDALTQDDIDSIIYDGVRETMRELAGKHTLYIVSNCQIGYIELFMKKSGTEDLIRDHLCFGETLTDKGTTIMTLMERNGITPEDTVYIGDTRGDHESSMKAGIRFIHASYGFGTTEDPDLTIGSFRELTKL